MEFVFSFLLYLLMVAVSVSKDAGSDWSLGLLTAGMGAVFALDMLLHIQNGH